MATTENKPGRLSGRAVIAIGLAFNAALLAIAYVVLIGWPGEKEAVAPSAIGGSFTMKDQRGRTVTEAVLKGKPYAIFFGFTRCPDVCPTTLSRMAQLRRKLGADGDRIAIVFVSLDPEHDKPADIGSYVAMFETPIIGLTGTPGQIAEIVKDYRVYYRKVPLAGGDYTIDHTASVFLMDANGHFVTTIDHAESQEMALAKMRRLLR